MQLHSISPPAPRPFQQQWVAQVRKLLDSASPPIYAVFTCCLSFCSSAVLTARLACILHPLLLLGVSAPSPAPQPNISLYTGFRVVLLPLLWHRNVRLVGDLVRDAATYSWPWEKQSSRRSIPTCLKVCP